MPLTPATTDKFQKVGLPGSASTLSSPGYTIGNASVTIGATTNHPTDTLYTFAIDRAQTVNGVTSRIAGTYCEFEGIVTGAQTIGSVVLKYGTAQNYPAGSFTRVYIPVSSNRENALIDGLNQDHNGKGNHKNLTDDNGNTWLARSQVASAVNNLQSGNAAAGGTPALSAVGSDTDIGLDINAKGAGIVRINGAAPKAFIQNAMFNFIESGCVWTADSPATTLLASMTAGVVWIAGKRLTVAAVSHRAFTLSKDTYVDFQDNGDGTAKIVYTEVANNAASAAIPNSLADATNVRNAIVVTGATNIAAASSVNQGQETALLPAPASGIYMTVDSLGNILCPRDPQRRLLAMRQVTATLANTAVSASSTGVSLLSLPINNIPVGRKLRVTISGQDLYHSSNGVSGIVTLWDGVVGSGTQLAMTRGNQPNGSGGASTLYCDWTGTPTSSFKTYNIGLHGGGAGTASIDGGVGQPIIFKVELE